MDSFERRDEPDESEILNEEAEHALRWLQFRAKVIAQVVAPNNDEIKQLRSRVLKDRNGVPMPPSEVSGWLADRENEQKGKFDLVGGSGKTFNYARVDGGVAQPMMVPAVEREPLRLAVHVNTTHGVHSGAVQNEYAVNVKHKGPLGWTFAASLRIADLFGWTSESAAGWFLCDSDPLAIGVTIEGSEGEKVDGVRYWRRLDVGFPAQISLKTLANAPVMQRNQWPARIGKPLGLRQLELVHFSIERNDGRTWNDVMLDWNRLAPAEWRYEGPEAMRHLSKDARRTFQKLMGKPYDWQRGGKNG